jgi:hypothetical protein
MQSGWHAGAVTIFRGCFWLLGCEVVITTPPIAFPRISL